MITFIINHNPPITICAIFLYFILSHVVVNVRQFTESAPIFALQFFGRNSRKHNKINKVSPFELLPFPLPSKLLA